jgi:acetylornithine deacetylase/succinyl-diaminopimelate desuccinylase-like protein
VAASVDPFRAEITRYLYGRGSTDMKSGVAPSLTRSRAGWVVLAMGDEEGDAATC